MFNAILLSFNCFSFYLFQLYIPTFNIIIIDAEAGWLDSARLAKAIMQHCKKPVVFNWNCNIYWFRKIFNSIQHLMSIRKSFLRSPAISSNGI